MMYYAEPGTCGSCKEFEYEGENREGYCRYRKAYYYPDDSCQYWEERDSGDGGMCFLTTACCEYMGLPDDCRELETMRHFRDTYLKQTEYGIEIITMYYRDAPEIVRAIENNENRDLILRDIYDEICKILKLIQAEKREEATIFYMMMVYRLRKLVC